MNIYKITQLQKDSLTNIQGLIFNPILDISNEWIITENEYFFILGLWYLDQCPNNLLFIKDLNSSVYLPKIETNLFK